MAKTKQQATSPLEFVAAVTQSMNLVGELSDTQRQQYGQEAVEMYDLDKASMKPWLDRMERGIKLASLAKDEKSYPFPNAANVKYPLITSAALQFNARAYPALVKAEGLVKAKVFGKDPEGIKAGKGERVASYMSWQLLHKIDEWEGETDKLLVQLPIVGTMIRKVWYDPVKERQCCKVLDAGKFIVNDRVKSLDNAPRLTEELHLYPNEIRQREQAGTFRQIAYNEDKDKQKAVKFIEQHCLMDLYGEGIQQPYVVTVCAETQDIVRVVADFEEDDVTFNYEQQEQQFVDPVTGLEFAQVADVPVSIKNINRGTYFIPYHFLPSLDGGFWGTGLGLLLGDITEAINSTINMLMDAGHMASLGAGFIGSEFRIKGGGQRFKPGEWKKVAANGGDIRQSLVPMTLPGPDATLYQMLGLLVEAGREVASVKDIMTGDTGSKNMTATTTLALIEQGMMMFTAAYKRIFSAMGKEFALISRLNARTVSAQEYEAFHEVQGVDPQEDFSSEGMDIVPVADPSAITKMQQMAKAELVMGMAKDGFVDPQAGAAMILEAAQVADLENLLPKPDPMAEQMQQMQMQVAMADLAQKQADIELTLAKVMEAKAGAQKDLADIGQNEQQMKFDATIKMLEIQRDDLADLITRGAGGMAGTPGNAAPMPVLV